MTQSRRSRMQVIGDDSLLRAIEAVRVELTQKLGEALAESMKQQGFTKTLKDLNRGRIPTDTGDIFEGVYERKPSGRYDLAVQLTVARCCCGMQKAQMQRELIHN